jgi:hypothetical protein
MKILRSLGAVIAGLVVLSIGGRGARVHAEEVISAR